MASHEGEIRERKEERERWGGSERRKGLSVREKEREVRRENYSERKRELQWGRGGRESKARKRGKGCAWNEKEWERQTQSSYYQWWRIGISHWSFTNIMWSGNEFQRSASRWSHEPDHFQKYLSSSFRTPKDSKILSQARPPPGSALLIWMSSPVSYLSLSCVIRWWRSLLASLLTCVRFPTLLGGDLDATLRRITNVTHAASWAKLCLQRWRDVAEATAPHKPTFPDTLRLSALYESPARRTHKGRPRSI